MSAFHLCTEAHAEGPDDDLLRRAAAIAAFLLAGLGAVSTLLFVAAFQFRSDWFADPALAVAGGAGGAPILQWAAQTDLFSRTEPSVVDDRRAATRSAMNLRLLGFGEVEVDGKQYDADIVIDRGQVRRRRKKPSKPYRDRFGHTPLSAEESIPMGRP